MCHHQEVAFLADRWKGSVLCYRMQSPICGASLLWSKYMGLEIKELGVAPFKTVTSDNPLSSFCFSLQRFKLCWLGVLLPKERKPLPGDTVRTHCGEAKTATWLLQDSHASTAADNKGGHAGWGNGARLPRETRVGATQQGQAGCSWNLRHSLGSPYDSLSSSKS